MRQMANDLTFPGTTTISTIKYDRFSFFFLLPFFCFIYNTLLCVFFDGEARKNYSLCLSGFYYKYVMQSCYNDLVVIMIDERTVLY